MMEFNDSEPLYIQVADFRAGNLRCGGVIQ